MALKNENYSYENYLHSCGLYTIGLVKTKILLIEHFFIEIFTDENQANYGTTDRLLDPGQYTMYTNHRNIMRAINNY